MIDRTNSISVKLTRVSVGVAVLSSIIFSLGELLVDIHNQKIRSKAVMAQVTAAVYPLATKVAYELNEYSADEVISGLFALPIVLSAELSGDQGQILAQRKRSVEHDVTTNLLNPFFSELEYLQLLLLHEYHEKPVGHLKIRTDISAISENVIDRFLVSLLFGISRNVVLTMALLFFFHKFLTRPFASLSRELSKIRLRPDHLVTLKKADHHEHDELGELVDSINTLLKSEFETGNKLRQSQKMEALGQLTGGIAHDFNNVLGIVLGNLELIELGVRQDRKTSAYVEDAIAGVNRGTEITRKLLNYSRNNAGESKVVSVNESVRKMGELISKSFAESVSTTISLEDKPWLVRVNPGDLQDALLNLSLNARDAMPEGGSLIIETSNKVLDEHYVRTHSQAETGEFVMISISDTGMGMNLDVQDRALEPFFTTKQEGNGTGLGLSMVYSFVRRSGGSFKIYSEVGEGTTIRIYLPRAFASNEMKNSIETPDSLPRGNETILIVDDEKALVELAAAKLESLGYTALTSETGKQALQLLKDHRNIDLLFSDIITPSDVDGYQLSLVAHELYPALKILLTSGFTKKRVEYANGENRYLARLVTNLVNKPYNLSELAHAVRKALDEDLQATSQ